MGILEVEMIDKCILIAIIENNFLLKANCDNFISIDLRRHMMDTLNGIGLSHLDVADEFAELVCMSIDNFSCRKRRVLDLLHRLQNRKLLFLILK
jgi:hypothetical protein